MADFQFDDAALSSLTSKINAKLHVKPEVAAPRKVQHHRRPKSTELKKSNIAADHRRPHEGDTSLQAPHPRNRDSQARPSEPARKRSRNGELKNNSAATRKSANSASTSRRTLLQEITELGGDEDDVALIDGIESESEVEGGQSKPEGNLSNDVKKFAKQLGISKDVAPKKKVAISRTATGFRADHSEGEESDEAEAESKAPVQRKPSEKHSSGKVNTASGNLLLDPLAQWYSVELPELSLNSESIALSPRHVEELHQRGISLLDKENKSFSSNNKSSSSSRQFYSTVITSGTLSDKVSALTLLVQESPLHNMRALETLLGLAKKRSRAQAIEVLTALKDLFGLGSLLPSTRHLRTFATQPCLASVTKVPEAYDRSMTPPKPLLDAHLVYWAFEDWLKKKYFEILQVVETWSGDEITFPRSKAVDMIFELLREKPEQEANLLRLLVNKLGDSEKKIASRASYNLLQLQNPHPMMKTNIISAIESDVLFRPGQTLHAKYYAVTTLNQTVLSADNEGIVRKLLDIYFRLFLVLLVQKTPDVGQDVQKNSRGEIQGGGGRAGKMAKKKRAAAMQKGASVEEAMREKITSAILTGINRAIPFTNTNDDFFEKHLDTLFRITHSSNFNTSIQALMLIQQLCGNHQAAFDRFYRTLYESLLDPRLLKSSKETLYLNLLYRAMKSDLNLKRVQAFAKRLLQTVAMHQPPFTCAVIYLLREVEGIFPALAIFVDQPEEAGDEEIVSKAVVAGDVSQQSFEERCAYDPKKRAPEYCHADRSCLWELDPLLSHFHPSVTLFASRLLTHDAMPSKPTLDSHTLMQFLDRFVYRNPKKQTSKWHGASIMQPLAAGDSRSQLLAPQSEASRHPVNSKAFAQLRDDQVKADEVFFHKYFTTIAQDSSKAKKKSKVKKGSDSEGEGEDDIWQALVDSKPDIEGSDGDVDMDAEDFSDMDVEELGAAMDELSSASDSEGDESVEWGGELMEPPSTTGLLEDDEPVDGKETSKLARGKDANKRRKQLRNLPTFASADDYAAMVNDIAGEELAP